MYKVQRDFKQVQGRVGKKLQINNYILKPVVSYCLVPGLQVIVFPSMIHERLRKTQLVDEKYP